MLRQFIQRVVIVRTTDEILEWRGKILIVLGIVWNIITLLTLGLIPVLPPVAQTIVIVAAAMGILIYSLVIWLAQRAWIAAGAIIIMLMLGGSVLTAMAVNNLIGTAPFFLVYPVIVAGLVLKPWQVWLVLGCVLAGLNGIVVRIASQGLLTQSDMATIAVINLVLLATGMLGFIGSWGFEQAIRRLRKAQQQANAATIQLAGINQDLEAQIAQRTAALTVALQDVEQRSTTQARLIEELAQQRALNNNLSLPLLPITDHALLVPLIGDFDETRIALLKDRVLRATEQSRSAFLVLDVTGLSIIDSQVGRGLLQLIEALRLLGTRTILVGIRPEVAQTMVSLGLGVGNIVTRSTLQSGLEYTLGSTAQDG